MMSKELIEQLAKEKAQEFKFSELGCELHAKINCGDISANAFMDIVYRTAFMEAYAQTQGQNIPDGWKLVPVKLTPEMRFAMTSAIPFHMGNSDAGYEAAINAAPIESGAKG